ncbi:MAG: DMT family transporter, partial [Bacteroidia bacterium]|nr:DMT family transporter [Bacteroidia bacterium]
QAVFQFEGDVKYSLLVILATVFYGSNINLIKTKLSHYKAIVISTLPLFFVSIPSSIILAMSDWSNLNTVANSQIIRSVGAVVVLGLIGTSLGLYLFNRMIQLSGPVFSSSVTYFIPIVAVVLGFLDGERILWIQLGGMALILTGVYLLNRARSTEDSGQPAQSDG